MFCQATYALTGRRRMDDVEAIQRPRQRVSLVGLIAGVARLRVDVDTGDVEARQLVTAGSAASAGE